MSSSQTGDAIVRAATVDDVDQMVDLLWSVAAEGRWLGTEVPFDRSARRAGLVTRLGGSDSMVYVADAGDRDHDVRIAGNITVDVATYGVATIGMLLAPAWRGRGLGAALLDAGLVWAFDRGAHKAALEVWPHNETALALYRKAGFIEEGRKRRHYRRANGELWDSILMGLPLGR